MGTTIKMSCGGCEATAETGPIIRTLHSVTGKSYGYGAYRYPTISEMVEPTGWVWSDPYTGCTYCPDCWKQIESGEAA